MVRLAPVRNQSKLTKVFRAELEILNIQSEQQQQRDDNLQLANLDLCPLSVRTSCELWISTSWRTELEIFNIQSEQQQQGDDKLRLANLHSCLPSVQTACELRICSLWKWLI